MKRQIIFFDSGYNFLEWEMKPIRDALNKKGIQTILIHDKEMFKDTASSVVVSNVPENGIWNDLLNRNNKIIQVTRSKDTCMSPRWINISANLICVASTIEQEAVSRIMGKNRVSLTGMPYLDYYGNVKNEPLDIILGIQVSFDAHGVTFTHQDDFLKDFYEEFPKKKHLDNLWFRMHMNHLDWRDRFIRRKIDMPVQETPFLLKNSSGIYTSHFSFMLMEACLFDKPIYIHHDNPEWRDKIENKINYMGWWSGYKWHELEKETKRKELKESYKINLDFNSGKRVAEEIMKFI